MVNKSHKKKLFRTLSPTMAHFLKFFYFLFNFSIFYDAVFCEFNDMINENGKYLNYFNATNVISLNTLNYFIYQCHTYLPITLSRGNMIDKYAKYQLKVKLQ